MSRTRILSGACAPALRRTKFSDVFEQDPFKIQSYNFRYAERPAYPVQNFRRPERQEVKSDKAFATYYYNPNFMARHDRDNKENVDNNRPVNQCPTKFAEFRRRKFLYESMSTSKPVLTKTGNSDWFKQLPSATVTPQQRQGNNNKSMFSQMCAAAAASGATTNTNMLLTCCNRDYLQRQESATSNIAQKTSSCALTCPNSKMQKEPQTQQQLSDSQTSTSPSPQKPRSRTSLAKGSVEQVNTDRKPSSVSSSTKLLNQEAKAGAVKNSIPATPKTTTRRGASQTRPTHALRTALGPRRSTCSGCEININISGMDEPSENVRIQIETDGCLMSKNTRTTARKQSSGNPVNNARSRSIADNSCSSNFVVHIDKHVSKYSLNGRNHNVITQRPTKRTSAQEAHEAQQAERASARERERERERLRELDREKDKQYLAQLEREREYERELQVENEKLAQMNQRMRLLNEFKQKSELERAARQIRAPIVPMTSHLYRQTSTERIPSMVPLLLPGKCSVYCKEKVMPERTSTISGLQPAAQAVSSSLADVSVESSQCEIRDQQSSVCGLQPTASSSVAVASEKNSQCKLRALRSRISCNALENLRGINPSTTSIQSRLSQTSTKALLPAFSSSKLSFNQQQTSLHPLEEIKLINTNNHLRTTLNNVPLRITTSTSHNNSLGWRPLSDVAFRTVRVRNDLPIQPFSENLSPCNLNFNVYADKMRKMMF